jgi:hypothetical protein
VCDYRRCMHWWMDLLTTYTDDSEVQVITALLLISTLSLLSLHESYPGNGFYTSITVTKTHVKSSFHNRTLANNYFIHSWTFNSHLNCIVISSQPPLHSSTELPTLNWTQLTTRLVVISHQPPSLLFTGWLSTDNSFSRPGVLAILTRDDPTENTASSISSTVFMGGCLEIARISLTCLPAVTEQSMFLLAIVA